MSGHLLFYFYRMSPDGLCNYEILTQSYNVANQNYKIVPHKYDVESEI